MHICALTNQSNSSKIRDADILISSSNSSFESPTRDQLVHSGNDSFHTDQCFPISSEGSRIHPMKRNKANHLDIDCTDWT